MEPDRRNRQISDIYHAALARNPAEREAFVRNACDEDEALWREVESLLQYEPQSSGFLESPAAVMADALEGAEAGNVMAGRQLGPYTIVAPLGAGGMGEVYRARDTKLGRDVAIKILPSHFTNDPERRARFAREARTLATLNHPHIGAIYGLEESDGLSALVLELVEGQTLAERLERGPLKIADALAIARQIADALDAAHEKGIVHRDLKPANVVLQGSSGGAGDVRAKVLDFGLAKLVAVDLADSPAPSGSFDGTADGRILGTPAYMSPEQARGLTVDKRTDIWAFGCVLFEMLTGQRAFEGDTVTDTLVRVLEREPEWTALPATTPEPVRKLLRRCLQKDPGRRVRDIGDARQELDEAPDALSQTRAPRGQRWWAIGLASLLIVALGVSIDRLLTRPDRPRILRPQRLTNLVGLEETPALSPDGRSVAFTAGVNGRRQVFVQDRAGGGEPNQITFDDADHQFPRWTPDSSWLMYFSPASPGDRQGTLYLIPALRGQAKTVASSMGAGDVRASDSRLTYFRLVEGKIELVTAPLDASTINVVRRFDPATGFHMHPRWSPDGKWIAYQAGANVEQEIYIVPAGGGEPERLTGGARGVNGFAWLPDSSGILYSSSRDDTMPYLPTARLWHVALADSTTTRPVTSGEASYTHPDIGRSGTVVATRLDLRSDIWKYPIDGSPHVNMQTAVRVTHQTGHVLTPTAGPGDQELAFLSDRGGHANLWVIDVGIGTLRQITNERASNVIVGVPVWSPAGDSIAYVSSRPPSDAPSDQQLEQSRPWGIWLVNRDGSNPRNIVKVGVGPSWSPDGRWLYYTPLLPGGLFKIRAEGGTTQTVRTDKLRNLIGVDGTTAYMVFERTLVDGMPVLEIHAASPENGPTRRIADVSLSRVPTWQILNPSLSPGGKWIAMALADGFSTNIWTLSTSTGEWRQITDFGGRPTFIARRVSWSSDGRSVLAAVADGDADIFLLDGLLNDRRD